MPVETHNAAEPIRIALCITELQVGGAERCLVELALRLDRARFTPVVYCLGSRPDGDQASLAERLDKAQIETHFLGAQSAFSFPRVLVRLTALFKQQRPHVAQSFLFHANIVTALAARMASVPRAITGIRVADRRTWHLRLARWTDRFVERHVCVSQAVADYSQQVGGLSGEKLAVISNGVDVERFTAATAVNLSQIGVPPGRRVLTFIGRLDAQKGLDKLLHLMPRVFEQFSNHDLLIVGRGAAQQSLEALARALNVHQRVHFAGWRSDIPEILAASDVLVLPSQWEGMPNVVLEAMASGKPIVANDAEGVSELLGPLAARQSAPRGDGHAFLAKLSDILANSDQASSLGLENRQRIEREFTLAAMADKYDRLYTELTLPGAISHSDQLNRGI